MPAKVATGLVWHYTSADGLEGIVRSNSLWASAVHALNDDRELLHGIDLIREAARDTPQEVSSWVEQASQQLHSGVLSDSFVASASLSGDSAHLFSRYGRYALGFSPSTELTKQPRRAGKPASSAWGDPRFASGWRQVIYGIPDGLKWARVVVEGIEGAADNLQGSEAVELIVRAAAYLKSDTWRDEQEVRLYGRAMPSGSRVSVRARSSELVRYVTVTAQADLSQAATSLPLRELRLSSELSARPGVRAAAQALLDDTGYPEVGIR